MALFTLPMVNDGEDCFVCFVSVGRGGEVGSASSRNGENFFGDLYLLLLGIGWYDRYEATGWVGSCQRECPGNTRWDLFQEMFRNKKQNFWVFSF